ncbi:MAG: hypothetical protein KKH94_02715 [Candidatus Omnitrophica bacterium]|nr:hypothetical protein [Candidatus Omnitrophota bacterium]
MNQLTDIVQSYEICIENAKISKIKQLSDEIAVLIINTDVEHVDVDIKKEKLKKISNRYFPDKMYLYDLLYESRFKRLWKQFRSKREGSQ